MKTVAIIALKGGCGKSTLATNLAVCGHLRGLRTALIDLDPQGTAERWGDLRQTDGPEVVAGKVSNLTKLLAQAQAAEADLVLIDTPPTDSAEARLAARNADLVLIPSRPDLWDVLAIETTWGMTRDEKKPAWVVLNACPPASPGMTKDALTTLASTRVEVSPQRINLRVAFGYAKNDGRGVAEYEPDGKAAEEMNSLFDWTMKRLDLNASKKKAA